MQEKSIYTYYSFGHNYRMLSEVNEGITIKSLASRIGDVFEQFEELDLRVTSAAATTLKELAEELTERNQDDTVDAKLDAKVKNAVEEFDKTLDAELGLVKAFILTPKRFDLRNLLETPQHLFSKGINVILEADIKKDLIFGFRCIAYEAATASAFHLLRATEGTLKQMYFEFIKQNRIKKPMWHGMVEALRAKRNPKPSEELLDHLDVIRKNYRNPTQHPDKFYSIDEAQDLASNCLSAINMMAKEIKNKK